jgi:trimeric autotransporter adhesin
MRIFPSTVAGVAGLGLVFAVTTSTPTNASLPRRVFVVPAARVNPAGPRRAMARMGRNASTGCSANEGTAGDFFVGVTAQQNVAAQIGSAVLGGGLNEACDPGAAVAGGESNSIGNGNTAATDSFDGGGRYNAISGSYGSIAAGLSGVLSGQFSFIGAGVVDTNEGSGSFVGAGDDELYTVQHESTLVPGNLVSGTDSFLGAGDLNRVSGNGSFVGAGGYLFASNNNTAVGNIVTGNDSFVGAGDQNVVEGNNAFVGAGGNNEVPGINSFIGGGAYNSASTGSSFVGAGFDNNASGGDAFVGAGGGAFFSAHSGETGTANVASATDSFVGAGDLNNVAGNGSFIGAGGYTYAQSGATAAGNHITGTDSFIGAGDQNTISATEAFVGSGGGNTIGSAASYATILGGNHNNVSGEYASILGGFGNAASGSYAIVAGGNSDTAAGILSFAAGYHADAAHNGSFVWSDYASGSATIKDSAANQFVVRASGGTYVYSNEGATSGVALTPGSGTWASLSDRNAKTGIVPLDDVSILAKLSTLPIEAWRYKTESGVRHVGPMAQDFYAAFGVGVDDRHITSIDEDGVALAAIKALHRENGQLRSRIAALQTQDVASESALRSELHRLEAAFAASRKR